MKDVYIKNIFNNILVLVLIVSFLCLIIYQIYLAINNKFHKNYSKLVEGLTSGGVFTPQSSITCTSNELPNTIYTVITNDISNNETLSSQVTSYANTINNLISNSNQSSSTKLQTITLTPLYSSPVITTSSNYSAYCNAINTNSSNITIISDNINSVINGIKELPNGPTALQNITFSTLTSNSIINPCSPIKSIIISSFCQAENINIQNINVLHGNVVSLGSAVNSLTSVQNQKTNNQMNGALTISSNYGLTTGSS